MKNYLDFRDEIRGLVDVSETVRVVDQIAASQIHKLRLEVDSLETYSNHVENIIQRLDSFDIKTNIKQNEKDDNKILVIIGGDKGLVGGLWNLIVTKIKGNYSKIYVYGNKMREILEEKQIAFDRYFDQLNNQGDTNKDELANFVMTGIADGAFSVVDILYPKYISLAEQTANLHNFYPFKTIKLQDSTEPIGYPIFNPDPNAFFNSIRTKYFRTKILKIITESRLSELSARTVSMEEAGVKTKKKIKAARMKFNKERRSFQTQMQLESFVSHINI